MYLPLLSLEDVSLVYPIYSIRAQSIRHSVLNLAVGGRLLRSQQDVIHVQALDGVSFTLNRGDRLGLLGHNGSGKTTLLKVIAGVYEPTRGTVSVQGNVSSMLDINLGVDWEASGEENITAMARIRGISAKECKAKVPDIIEFSELGSYISLPMKTYSAGMAARLIFAVVTSFAPNILVLDEWLAAGDSQFLEKAAQRMDKLVGEAQCVVFATHSIDMVRRICNKVCIMENGRVSYFGLTSDCFPDAKS